MPAQAVADLEPADIAASSLALPRRAEQLLTVPRRLDQFDGARPLLAGEEAP
jgi:hypothetical protein